jgi:hypothetical protein
MPFEKGNKAAAGKHRVKSAIERALARFGGTVDKGLDKITDQLVAAAAEGEQWAMQMIADRLDGKPHAFVEMAVTDDRPQAPNAEQLADKLASALAGRAPVTERTIQ